MPRMQVEQPVETEVTHYGQDRALESKHPAYGQVAVSRRSGGQMALYGSDMLHDTTIALSITRSRMERMLAREWHYAEPLPIIEIVMSEAQWATMVSSLNFGSGTPCTITYADGKRVPLLPDPEPSKRWKRDIDIETTELVSNIKEAIIAANGLGLSKTKAAEITSRLERIKRAIESSIPFIKDSFNEHMEGVVEKAKADVHAHMTHAITTAGLDVLNLSGPKKDKT
jgi:hypothetical protein